MPVGDALMKSTVAIMPSCVTLPSVHQFTVRLLPVEVHEPPLKVPVTSAGEPVLGPLNTENLSQHVSSCTKVAVNLMVSVGAGEVKVVVQDQELP